MKKQNRHILCAAVLAVALLLALMAGCGTPTDGPGTAEPGTEATTDVQTPDTDTGTEVGPGAPAEDPNVYVSSVEELLAAIEPGASIVIEPGYYNLSEYMQAMQISDITFPYVTLEECFDGTELVIRDVDTLTIRGGSENAADTELVVEPRYANVLTFDNCNDIAIASLTLGHTEQGSCRGSVLVFQGSQYFELSNLDLYGCGVYALKLTDGSGYFQITDCTLRDCSDGPFYIEDAVNEIIFDSCVIDGSAGGGFYAPSEDSGLIFLGCTFGQAESNMWYFRDDVYKDDNCTWCEITEYPDYSYMEYAEGA